jgi:hypothetical protein
MNLTLLLTYLYYGQFYQSLLYIHSVDLDVVWCQCCGSVIFWYWSGYVPLTYRSETNPAPLFSSVADKMPTTNMFIFNVFLLIAFSGTFTRSKIRSHKIKVFLTFLVCWWKDLDPYKIMIDPDPGGQKHMDPDPDPQDRLIVNAVPTLPSQISWHGNI